MGVSAGPNIIRDSSLVLELDAADRNSYLSGSTIWYDLSSNSNNISLSNTTFVDDKRGIIQFDGSTSVGTAGYSSTLSVPDYHTIDVWMYVIGAGVTSAATGVIIRAGQVADEQYSLMALPGGGWYSQWISGSSFVAAGDSTYGPPQTWNHFVLVRNLTNMSFYYNGVQTFSQTVDITTRASFGTLSLGRTTANTTQRFYGNIGNLRVYNRSLSQQEIQQNYNALKTRFK